MDISIIQCLFKVHQFGLYRLFPFKSSRNRLPKSLAPLLVLLQRVTNDQPTTLARSIPENAYLLVKESLTMRQKEYKIFSFFICFQWLTAPFISFDKTDFFFSKSRIKYIDSKADFSLLQQRDNMKFKKEKLYVRLNLRRKVAQSQTLYLNLFGRDAKYFRKQCLIMMVGRRGDKFFAQNWHLMLLNWLVSSFGKDALWFDFLLDFLIFFWLYKNPFLLLFVAHLLSINNYILNMSSRASFVEINHEMLYDYYQRKHYYLSFIYQSMHFFQNEQQRKINFHCLHISHLHYKQADLPPKPLKKPFERYKDMKQAIKLIQRGENPIFTRPETPINSFQSTSGALFHSQNRLYKIFPARRIRVTQKKSNPHNYRQILIRSMTIDRLIKSY